jgi:hypothetical protein
MLAFLILSPDGCHNGFFIVNPLYEIMIIVKWSQYTFPKHGSSLLRPGETIGESSLNRILELFLTLKR